MFDPFLARQPGGACGHNKHYLKLIGERRPDWQKAKTHNDREEIARQIIASIARLSPPGRFLKKLEYGGASPDKNVKGRSGQGRGGGSSATAKTKLRYPVDDKCAIDKIWQALREKAKQPPPPPPSCGDVRTAVEVTNLSVGDRYR